VCSTQNDQIQLLYAGLHHILFSKRFFQVTESYPNDSLNVTSIDSELNANACYEKLLWLWYLFCLEIAADLNHDCPIRIHSIYWDPGSFGMQLLIYICQVAVIVLLLWVWILIFMAPGLQRIWRRGIMGRIMRKKRISVMAWMLVFAVILTSPHIIIFLIYI